MSDWSDAEIADIARAVSNWGRWGEVDELGTVYSITAETRARAATEISTGEMVSLGRPLQLGVSPSLVNAAHAVWRVFEPVEAASEYIGLTFHGTSVTHIDTLCHLFTDAQSYNGFNASTVVPRTGAARCSIEPCSFKSMRPRSAARRGGAITSLMTRSTSSSW